LHKKLKDIIDGLRKDLLLPLKETLNKIKLPKMVFLSINLATSKRDDVLIAFSDFAQRLDEAKRLQIQFDAESRHLDENNRVSLVDESLFDER
jgi:hypothetical protein